VVGLVPVGLLVVGIDVGFVVVGLDVGLLVVGLDVGLFVVGRRVGLLVVVGLLVAGATLGVAIGFAVDFAVGVRRNATSLFMSMKTPAPKPTVTTHFIRVINMQVSERDASLFRHD
jgi:hypothetical protein